MIKNAHFHPFTNSLSIVAWVALFLFLLVFTGCDIIFIPDTSEITSFPDHYNQVMNADDRIYIDFPFDVDRLSVETLFTVESATFSVEGYYTWEETTCYFNPVPPLTYGKRYVLKCIGDVKDTQSRPYPVNIEIPFFYITDNAAPLSLSDITPEEGDIILPSSVLTIIFSNPVDEYSFKKGFSLLPDTSFSITWDDEKRSFFIEPDNEWTNLTLYTITLSQEIVDCNGMPLVREYTSTFFIQASTTQPVVTGVVPAQKDWISPFPAIDDSTLNDIEYNDAIRIEFSEPMDRKKTESAVSLTPPLAHTTTWIDDLTFILIPDKGFVMDTEYTISITREAENIYGIPLAADEIIHFTPAIEPLIVNQIVFEDGQEILFPDYSTDEALTIDVIDDNDSFEFSFIFSQPLVKEEEKIATMNNITLSCIFPPDGGSPIRCSFGWISNIELSLKYTGFLNSNTASECYYMLEIMGGENGICTNGSFLREDIKQLLKAEKI
jgi:hypothetical protein